MTISEVMKEVSSRWSNLSKDEKRPFEILAKIDKKRYDKEFNDYKIKKRSATSSNERCSGAGKGEFSQPDTSVSATPMKFKEHPKFEELVALAAAQVLSPEKHYDDSEDDCTMSNFDDGVI
jgi:hypothetical protein